MKTKQELLILDGGMGQELLARSGFAPTKLWSSQFTLDHLPLVQALHEDYLAAGAQVITLNTYTATPSRLVRDADISLMPILYANAYKAAAAAVNKYPGAQIAGCLPPLVASYVATELPNFEQCVAEYRQIVAMQSHVDFFLIETMSNLTEARAALMACKGKRVWLSYSVSDEFPGQLRQGESLQVAIDLAKAFKPEALLINCSSPEAINQNTALLSSYPGRTGIYANAFASIAPLPVGGTVKDLKKRDNLDPSTYLEFVKQWYNQGISIVGGCCEIGPQHIKVISDWKKEMDY